MPGANNSKLLWWIIGILSSVTMGAGSSYVTRLDGMAKLTAQVELMGQEISGLKKAFEDEFRHGSRRP